MASGGKSRRASSVVKRRFGGAVTARGYWQQVKQTMRRGMTYNLYRAVQLGLSWHLRPIDS